MSERAKIGEQHRRRRGVVYLRQSALVQVASNVESAERQYALVERAVELGWPREQVAVVDEDTGHSAASSEGRIGFKELVASVGLGEVGIILALEVSRLARCSADWHRLLDLCALTGALIADQDGVYSLTSVLSGEQLANKNLVICLLLGRQTQTRGSGLPRRACVGADR
jgi:DNA invertase Pin-like site-specific DNA recombinase